jgi:isopenicillin N synthase-like dioxygenase
MVDAQKLKLLDLMERALKEMEEQKTLAKAEFVEHIEEWGVFWINQRKDYWEHYDARTEELKSVYEYLNHEKSSGKNAYRHMQLEIFNKHETFFMDLFATRQFPWLFMLFEFVWRD